MRKLHIIASPRGERSKSIMLSNYLSSQIDGTEEILDLSEDIMPFLTENVISYMYGYMEYEKLSEEEKDIADLQQHLIDQIKESDILIISTPMWNFGLPASLKAYFDLVTKYGGTFTKGKNGFEGLVKNIKQAYIIGVKGLIYEKTDLAPYDFLEGHIKKLLSYIGIDNIKAFWLEGANTLSPEEVEKNIDKLKEEIKNSLQS